MTLRVLPTSSRELVALRRHVASPALLRRVVAASTSITFAPRGPIGRLARTIVVTVHSLVLHHGLVGGYASEDSAALTLLKQVGILNLSRQILIENFATLNNLKHKWVKRAEIESGDRERDTYGSAILEDLHLLDDEVGRAELALNGPIDGHRHLAYVALGIFDRVYFYLGAVRFLADVLHHAASGANYLGHVVRRNDDVEWET